MSGFLDPFRGRRQTTGAAPRAPVVAPTAVKSPIPQLGTLDLNGPEVPGSGFGANAGFGNKPNGSIGDMLSAIATGAPIVFGGPLGLVHLGASAVTGKPPGLVNSYNAVTGRTPAPAGGSTDGLSSGALDASAMGGLGAGALGGTMGSGLNAMGDITGGGSTMSGQRLASGGVVVAGKKSKEAPIFGIIRGAAPGVDTVPAVLAEGSYVIPAAAVVSFGASPSGGIEKLYGKPGSPTGDGVEVHVSGGEYVMSPEQVQRAGGVAALDQRFGVSSTPKDKFAEGGAVTAPQADATMLSTGPAPTTAPASAPTPPSGVAPTADPRGSLSDMVRSNIAAGEKISADVSSQRAGMQRGLDDLRAKLNTPAPESQYNPVDAFGSAAMLLATTASMFTRRPWTNVLNAGADVLEARKKGDALATQQAFEKWKTSTDHAIQIQKFENDAYEQAIRGSKEELAVAAAMFKNKTALWLIENGRRDEAISLMTGHRFATGTAGTAAMAINDYQRRLAASKEYNRLLSAEGAEAADAFLNSFYKTEGIIDPKYAALAAQPELKREKLDLERTKIANDMLVASGKLDLAKLTQEQRQAIAQGSLDLRRMTEEDMKLIREGRLDLDTWAARERVRQGDERIKQGDTRLELQGISDRNRQAIAREKLDLTRLSIENQRDIAEGKIDLARMSARDLADYRAGKLDLADWIGHERVRQGDARIGQTDQGLGIRAGAAAETERHNLETEKIRRDQAAATGTNTMGGQHAKLVEQYISEGMSREDAIAKASAIGRKQSASDYAVTQVQLEQQRRAAAGQPPMDAAEAGRKLAIYSGKGALNAKDLNDLQNRAQALTVALDKVHRMEEIMARTRVVSGGLNRVLKPGETIGNLLDFTSDTDRHDFDSALDFLKLNAPVLLKHANSTSRTIAGDQGLVNSIMRGGNWGDTYYNVKQALRDNSAIWRADLQLLQQQNRAATGTPMAVPGLTPPSARPALAPPPASAAPATRPSVRPRNPWESDPVAP